MHKDHIMPKSNRHLLNITKKKRIKIFVKTIHSLAFTRKRLVNLVLGGFFCILLFYNEILPYSLGLGWWSEWTNWNSCAGQCEWGNRRRSRECPREYCEGEGAQTVVCDLPVYCSCE